MMVKLTRIYTRGGDTGKTSLTGGTRVSKDDCRVRAYGDVDETNAAIGIARLYVKKKADAMLMRIQHDLFDLGADLSTPHSQKASKTPLRMVAAQVTRLEKEIDAMNAGLKPLNSFVLPGGEPSAAFSSRTSRSFTNAIFTRPSTLSTSARNGTLPEQLRRAFFSSS